MSRPATRPRSRLGALLLALAGVAALPGCATQGALCLLDCGSRRSASTSLVEYLYPDGAVPAADASAELRLPLRVGLSFLPSRGGPGVDAVSRQAVLDGVRERFRSLPYVREIVIVPDMYLAPAGGFDALQQVARLQDLDVIALVSSDQVSHTGENSRALMYLTVVGAFLVRGSEHETHTLLDLAVIHPASRSLLLRAGGTSSLADSSTAIDQGRDLRNAEARGMARASGVLMTNLGVELERFAARVRDGDAPVRVTRRSANPAGSGGGGGLGVATLAGLALLLLCGNAAWRGRDSQPAGKPLRPVAHPSTRVKD
jgi:rhombotail lipoprotein